MLKKVKNGRIELYRFIFCMIVLLFHINKYILKIPANSNLNLSFFNHGAIGVEFFFVLSGYFMASSIYKIRLKNPDTANSFSPNEALSFMKKKYLSVFPQHAVAFVLVVITVAVAEKYGLRKFLLYLLDSIPNFFLVQMTGINYTSPNHIEWYISCMLISMAVLYPVIRKYYDNFTRYFAPLLALLIFGHMIYTTHKLTGVSTWYGLGYKSVLRSIAEISLGTTAFELARNMSKKQYSKNNLILFTVIEFACLLGTVFYAFSDRTSKYEIYCVPLIFIMVTICLSEQSLGHKLFNNKFVYFLGKLSLPIYLTQLAAINVTNAFMTEYNNVIKFIFTIMLVFVFSLVVMKLGSYLSVLICKLEMQFAEEKQKKNS